MKKNIIKLLIAGAALFSVGGCRDALEIVQDGELSNNATFSSVSNMQQYLNSVLATVDNTSQIKFTSVFTDEVGYGSSNTGQDVTLHRFFLDVNDGYAASIWLTNYTTINRVNRLLEGATLVHPAADQTAMYNDIIAQARAIRAYAYLELETYFSTNMKDDNALGVMLSSTVPDINAQLPRSKNADIYALMESDLAFAENNLMGTAPTATNYIFPTKSMVDALRARFYLYRGNTVKAQQYAQSVIAGSGLTLTPAVPYVANTFYSNASTNPYRQMWNDKSQGEIVFALSRPVTGAWGNVASLYTTNSTTAGGSPLFDMGRNLFNIINGTPGDIRRYAFIDPSSKIDPNYLTNPNFKTSDVLVIDKYPGKYTGTQPLRNDLKIFRLSEMYFILAECAVPNNLVAAATYIKAVRDARSYTTPTVLPVYANATAAYADILKERRVELAYEGHRYIDLKRLGTLAGAAIDRNITDDSITTLPTTIPNGDYRFTLPIPQAEIQGNPNIQQNPGYTK